MRRVLALAAVLSLVAAGCSRQSPVVAGDEAYWQLDAAELSELQVQALLLNMADDYLAALGEARYLGIDDQTADLRSRTLAQSLLRNGTGAAMDIATQPNPIVGVLDLLVLSRLQVHALETHWIPAGIGPGGEAMLERLRRLDAELWTRAEPLVDDEHRRELETLIAGWIESNPDAMVVSLVRFDEFLNRNRSAGQRDSARGLLRDIGNAVAAVDEARLLAERSLWFAGRYPYLLGQQVELTVYRLLGEPEAQRLLDAVESVDALESAVEQLTGEVRTVVDRDVPKLREETIGEIDALVERSVKSVAETVSAERKATLDELSQRAEELEPTVTQLQQTVASADELAKNLTLAADAGNRLLSRLSVPDESGEPTAIDLGRVETITSNLDSAAVQLAGALERADTLAERGVLDREVNVIATTGDALLWKAFWMTLVLIVVTLGGLALLKVVPRRIRN